MLQIFFKNNSHSLCVVSFRINVTYDVKLDYFKLPASKIYQDVNKNTSTYYTDTILLCKRSDMQPTSHLCLMSLKNSFWIFQIEKEIMFFSSPVSFDPDDAPDQLHLELSGPPLSSRWCSRHRQLSLS